jgi:hypothetical protein
VYTIIVWWAVSTTTGSAVNCLLPYMQQAPFGGVVRCYSSEVRMTVRYNTSLFLSSAVDTSYVISCRMSCQDLDFSFMLNGWASGTDDVLLENFDTKTDLTVDMCCAKIATATLAAEHSTVSQPNSILGTSRWLHGLVHSDVGVLCSKWSSQLLQQYQSNSVRRVGIQRWIFEPTQQRIVALFHPNRCPLLFQLHLCNWSKETEKEESKF